MDRIGQAFGSSAEPTLTTVRRIKKEDTGRPDAEAHQVAAKPPAKGLTWRATLGILTYAAVGAFVVGIWLGRSAAAPDLIRAYGLGVVGWLAGAFTAYFHPSE